MLSIVLEVQDFYVVEEKRGRSDFRGISLHDITHNALPVLQVSLSATWCAATTWRDPTDASAALEASSCRVSCSNTSEPLTDPAGTRVRSAASGLTSSGGSGGTAAAHSCSEDDLT